MFHRSTTKVHIHWPKVKKKKAFQNYQTQAFEEWLTVTELKKKIQDTFKSFLSDYTQIKAEQEIVLLINSFYFSCI